MLRTTRNIGPVLAAFLALGMVAGGCDTGLEGDSETTPTSATLTETNGAGRTWTTADGALTIEVPRGVAIEEPITAAVLGEEDLPDELADQELSGTVYDLLPAGATFDEPITVTRRIPIENFGWDPEDGVPATILAVRDEDGQWEYLRDQRTRLDGDTVVVSATTTHFSPLVVIGLPAQVRLADDAATVQLAPGEEVPVPTAGDVGIYGPDEMFEAIEGDWRVRFDEGSLVMTGGPDGTIVDEQTFDPFIESWTTAREQGAAGNDDGFTEVAGSRLIRVLQPTFNSQIFRDGLLLGDLDAWEAPLEPATSPVTCLAPDDATTALAIDAEGLIRPLLGSVADSALPGLEGDVPALTIVTRYDLRCTGAGSVPATAVPQVAGTCLQWNDAADGGKRVRIGVRIDGIGGEAREASLRVGLPGTAGSDFRAARYREEDDLWIVTARTSNPSDVRLAIVELRTADGASYQLGNDLQARLGELDISGSGSGSQGDLCDDLGG